ncbi:MAG: Ig-like domain-containing protein [Fluviibacter sp.]
MANFETYRDAKNELVLASLRLAVLFAPMSTTPITTLENPTTGDLVSLPNYRSAGLIEKGAGVDLGVDTSNNEIEAYGDAEPVRTIINKRTTTFQATYLETNITTLEHFWGTDYSGVVPSSFGGVVLETPSLPKNIYYRCILLGQDDVDGDPLYPYWIMPRVKLEKVDNQGMKDDNAVSYNLTFRAFKDAVAGFSVAQGFTGPGWTHLVSRAGFVAAPTALTVAAASGQTAVSSLTAAAGSAHTTQLKVTGNNGINYTPVEGVTYSSATPAKATVSSTGLVTGVAAGTSVITASYLPAGESVPVTGTVTVTVS